MSSQADDDTRLLAHAYVDGELDAAAALAFERRLAAEPALQEDVRRLTALQDAVRERLPRYTAPPGLRAKVLASARPPASGSLSDRARRLTGGRPAMAAALLLGLALGSGTTLLVVGAPERPVVAEMVANEDVVAGHVRALATGTPFDVASSDRHTVKPWFAGRLTFAPRVVDLAAEGFPLAGGRLDMVKGTLAATLVYRRGKHVISLTEMPDPQAGSRPPRLERLEGFSMVRWAEDGSSYWAVTDAAPQECEALVAAFRAKAAGG